MLGLDAPTLISRALILVIAFTIHELAHAWTAVELGDDTPRRMGRMTLNPLAHLDPIGSLLLLVAGFGWAKPVMTNPYNLRPGPRTGIALVAAAGPFSNFVLAILAAVPFRAGLLSTSAMFDTAGRFFPTPASFLAEFIFINLILMVFNLLPIVPLDGSKVLRGLAPPEWDSWLNTLERWGPFILIGLVFLGGRIFSLILIPPTQFLFRLLVGV